MPIGQQAGTYIAVKIKPLLTDKENYEQNSHHGRSRFFRISPY